MIGIAPFYYAAKAVEYRAARPVTVSRRRRRQRSAVLSGALGRRRRVATPALGN